MPPQRRSCLLCDSGIGSSFHSFNATAQDYIDIQPALDAAKILVGLQLMFEVGWAIVIFTAVMAYIQPLMDEATRRLSKKRSSAPD